MPNAMPMASLDSRLIEAPSSVRKLTVIMQIAIHFMAGSFGLQDVSDDAVEQRQDYRQDGACYQQYYYGSAALIGSSTACQIADK